ncbi:MAG: HAD-IA family hydrolase [Candidatus Bathyarchaeota archaeon]|nr:HAD-IA family hydrolase [Candidatus Bathyarchaeota archaeon]
MQRVRLVVFDMAGTTVDDRIDNIPLVLKSYSDAFESHGVHIPMEILNEQRGRDKWTVIKELGGDKAKLIYRDFVETLLQNTSKVKEMDGASDTFRFLKEHGVKVVCSTGFPTEVSSAILKELGWQENGLIDGWICSEQVGASRPDPAMILHAMNTHGIENPNEVVKVDDTAKGVEEGLNAGVLTVAVLSGTQSIQRLDAAGPHTILRGVGNLPDYLLENGYVQS